MKKPTAATNPTGPDPSVELKPGGKNSFQFEVAKRVMKEELPLPKVLAMTEQLGYFDTGLMPQKGSGLLNYRRGGGMETFVYQVAPGIHSVIWGASEGSRHAARLRLAMPYRIIIGDHEFVNGRWQMIGARHFYSPVPVRSWDTPLYNCNVPNLNCRGYNGTGVGWICLYHKESYADMDMHARVMATVQRTSGNEAYNDANMSETDGPRYYEAVGKPSYFWDSTKWQEKSKNDGWEWTLDADLLIPVQILHPAKNMMDKNYSKNDKSKHANLFDLTRGLYKAYYHDRVPLKPVNLMDPNNPFAKLYPKVELGRSFSRIANAFDGNIRGLKAMQVIDWTPKIERIACDATGELFMETDEFIDFIDNEGNTKKAHASHKDKLVMALFINKEAKWKTAQWKSVVTLPEYGWKDLYGRFYHNTVEKGKECPSCKGHLAAQRYGGRSTHENVLEKYNVCENCLPTFTCKSCRRCFKIDRRSDAGMMELLKPTEMSAQIKVAVLKAVKEAGGKGNFKSINIKIDKEDKDTKEKVEDICVGCAASPRNRVKACACGADIDDNVKTTQFAGVKFPVCEGCVVVEADSKIPTYLPKESTYSSEMSKLKFHKSEIFKITDI